MKKINKKSQKSIVTKNCITMRPHQKEVFDLFRNYRYVSVEQPPGSGKSALTQFIFADKSNRVKDAKLVITIPQNLISSNYSKSRNLKYAEDNIVEWAVSDKYNLCLANSKHVVNRIIDFINEPLQDDKMFNRVMICSHTGLTLAFQKCPNLDFTNTYLVVDESHHSMIAKDNKSDYAISNGLGDVIRYHLNQDAPGSGLWLTTATFFRGDCYPVLSEEIKSKFKVSFMPLDEHFKNLNIESYSYDFIPYFGEYPKNEIQKEFKGRLLKTIVYIPQVDRLWSGTSKKINVENIVNIIRKEQPNARILDLVNWKTSPVDGALNTGHRDRRKKYLMDHPSEIDVVLAVRLLDEGTDWVYAEKVLDLAPSESLRISCQRFGRLLRDAPGKKHIFYKVFFPCCYHMNGVEEGRNALNKYFAIKSMAFILRDDIMPIKTITKPKSKVKSESKKNNKKNQKRKKTRYFVETVPDVNKRADVYNDVQFSISKIVAEHQKDGSNITAEEGRSCILKALKKRGVKKHIKKIVKEIEIQFFRASYPKFNIKSSVVIDAIHWEKIAENTVGIFVSGKQEGQTWDKLRKILNMNYKSEKEHLDLMREQEISSDEQWRKYYRENDNLQEEGYYLYVPQPFGKTHKEFFDQLRVPKISYIEQLNFMKKNGIRGYTEWLSFYDKHELNKKGYRKHLWLSMKISQKEFFEQIRDAA